MRVLKAIWKIIRGIASGDILSTFKIGHFLPQIICIVGAATIYMLLAIYIDATLAKVEKNKVRIEELKIELALKTKTYAAQRKLENIEKTLKEGGIDIHLPDKPATRIKD